MDKQEFLKELKDKKQLKPYMVLGRAIDNKETAIMFAIQKSVDLMKTVKVEQDISDICQSTYFLTVYTAVETI